MFLRFVKSSTHEWGFEAVTRFALRLLSVVVLLALGEIASRVAPVRIAEPLARPRHAPVKIRNRVDHGSTSSTNWSGYALSAGANTVTQAGGSWIVPTVNCTAGPSNAYSAFWVGIDGWSSNTVEQTGTDSDCSNGTPTYYAWYEFYPAQSFLISSLSITPGEVVSGQIIYNGSGQFTVSLTAGGSTFTKTGTVNSAQRSSAECIAEAPSSTSGILPLADFGSVLFGFDHSGTANTCGATVSGVSGSFGSFGTSVSSISMVSSGGADEAVPTALSSDGTSFTVNYVSAAAPALSISKSHSGSFTQGQNGATYSVLVSNSPSAGSTSGTVTVTESVPSGLTLVSMNGGSTWNCSGNSCTTNNVLAAGSSYPTITVTVNVASNATSPQVNQVSVSGGGSATASAPDSTTVIAGPPVLAISKSHNGNFAQGQNGETYSVVVSNSASAGPTSGTVTVTETVPSGLTLVSMSGGATWNCSGNSCTTNSVLTAGSSYPAITVKVNVASNATSPQVNQVSVSGGGSTSASATDSTTIVGVPAALSISKSHSGSFTQGQNGATYSVVVSNSPSAGSTSGTTTVTETVPPGMTLVSMAGGSTWNCAGNTCTTNNVLTPGSSYPAITVMVNVAGNASSPQVNQVSVSGGGSSSASATDSTTITAVPPVLAIGKSHNGSFMPGQNGATYSVVVSNTAPAGTTSGTVTVTETPPSGLTVVSMAGTGWSCAGKTCTNTNALAGGASYSPITVTANVAANATSPQVNQVSVSGGGSASANASDSTTIVAVPPVLSISKSHSGNFAQGQNGATYSVVVNNSPSGGPTSGTVTVTETVPSGLTLVSMAGGSAWSCAGNTCTTNNVLSAGSSYPPITVTVNVASNATSPQVNQVSVAGGGSVSATAMDSTTIIAVPPVLSISKSHSGNFSQGQNGATYSVVVSSSHSGGPTSGPVTATETVPSGLTLVSMAGGATWNCSGNACTTNTVLAAGSSYPPITVTVNVASNATSPQVNQVSVAGGGSASANASDSTTIVAVAPALSISKSHGGNFSQGQNGATYSVVVSNSLSAGPTSGAVTVTETVPSGLTLVSMAGGSSWNCSGNTCTTNNVLAAGSSYPPITVTVNVASNATSPQVNQVSVAGGGSASASATDSTTILAVPPVLSISKSHSGTFSQGQNGAAYSVVVSNGGSAGPTSGAVTVTETVPSGLTLVSMAGGPSWNCAGNTCTTNNVLAAGASYPPITVTVNVASNAGSPQVNQVSVAGGGSASASATDSTAITIVPPVLSVSENQSGSFTQGQKGATYSVVVTNTAPAGTTSGMVTVTETVPAGLTLASMAGSGWSCAGNSCSTNNVGPAGASYPAITVTVNVAPNAASPQVNQISVSGGGSAGASATDSTTIVAVPPVLSISESQSGSFTLGQNGATYAVVVSNTAPAGATSGMVTVTETLPSGLTLVSMAGAGWSCAGKSCTNGNALGGGASYPPITVTVNVAANATSPQVNQVGVSGGASPSANATDSATITGAAPAFFAGSVNGGGGTEFLQFPDGIAFGYYAFVGGGWMYHADMGYESVVAGPGSGVYFWDLASGHWFYTDSATFPYLFDFSLNAWLYYFPNTQSPGHYSTNPRYFSNLSTGTIFTM